MELGTPPSVRVDLRIYPHDEGVGIAPDPPLSFAATTSSVVTSVSGTVPARWTETCMLPVSAPLPSAFYMNGVSGRSAKENEREREREYGMGYEQHERGRRSPPLFGSRVWVGYGRGVTGDRRDDWRYVLPPPTRTS